MPSSLLNKLCPNQDGPYGQKRRDRGIPCQPILERHQFITSQPPTLDQNPVCFVVKPDPRTNALALNNTRA